MAASSERIREIQEEIVRQKARPAGEHAGERAVLTFFLAGERYAFPLEAVREVCRPAMITALPGLPPVVLGAMGLRGEVLAVLDLRRLLGLAESPLTPASRLIVIHQGTITAALLVDQVEDISALAETLLQPPPAEAGGREWPFLQAIAREGERVTRLLDPAGLLEAVRHAG